MVITSISINQDLLEKNAREIREVLTRSFSEARRRLDEREAQLSLQLEEKINEVNIHNKIFEFCTRIHALRILFN